MSITSLSFSPFFPCNFLSPLLHNQNFFLLDLFSRIFLIFPVIDRYHIPDFLLLLASKFAVYLPTMMRYFGLLNSPLSDSSHVIASTSLALTPVVSLCCHLYEFALKNHRKLPYASGNRKKNTLVNTDTVLHPNKVCKVALRKENKL